MKQNTPQLSERKFDYLFKCDKIIISLGINMKHITQRKIQSLAFLAVGAVAVATGIGLTVHFNSDSNSKQYLLEHGFTQPEITGLKWTCSEGTFRHFEFKAIDNTGNEVEGYVCATRLILSDNITIEKTTPASKSSKLKM